MKSQKRYKTGRQLPFQEVYPLRQDKKCRRCEKPLTGKQTSWCSDQCLNTAFHNVMLQRGDPSAIRLEVFSRDDGICALCGIDCKRIQRISDAANESLYQFHLDKISIEDCRYVKDKKGRYFHLAEHLRKEYFKFARKLWRDTPLNFGSSCWHADHIVEIVNGGSNALENIQTLCISCHKLKTRNLVKAN